MSRKQKGLVLAVMAIGIMIACFVGCRRKDEAGIRIGAILPLTGDAAKYGASARKSIDLVVSKADSAGGIKGKTVTVLYEDTKGTGRDGVSAIQKLVTVDHVPAVIGDLLSSVTLAVAPVAEKHHVVLLSPTSSAPKITYAGDYIFRNCASDLFEGGLMAEAALQKLAIKTVAILYVNNEYGVGITEVFRKVFADHGGTIIAEEAFPQSATDFRSQLTKINTLRPDGVYIVGYKELGQLLKQARELGMRTQFMSTVMFEDPDILSVAGDAAEGVIYSARAYDPNADEPQTKEFVTAFRNRYGEEPDIFAAYSYDAARILLHAIENGGETADAIKTALHSIRNFPGVTGTTSFDENGDVVQPAFLKIVKKGRFMRYQ